VDADGLPNVRMVLLKGFDDRGFVFYTNFESAKGREILGAMKAAMCFHWKSLRRQVRVRGPVEVVSDEEADAYYASRPRGSRLGVQTIAPLGKPVCAGKGGGGIYGTLCGGQYSTPFLLVGLSHIAAVDRILARSTVPLARPRHVQPSRKRGMGENKALPLRLGLSRHLERPRATDQPAFLRFMKAMNAARASLDFRRWRNSSLSCWIRSSRGSRGPRIRSRVTLSASGGFCATASAAASTVASS